MFKLRIALAATAIAWMPAPAFAQCSLSARICQIPELAKLDADLVAKERAVQAATARPATWAARARSFRTWIATATDADGNPFTRAALAGHITDQIDTLNEELERAEGISAAASPAEILGDKCLAKWLAMDCKVPAAGVVRGEDGTQILWQLQSGASESDGGGMGAMLWDATAPGAPKFIGWTFEGVWMEAPRYDAERKLLWVSGRMVGTGDGNADILFQNQNGKWVEIELESWRDALAKRLPKGLGAWHGVDYELVSLSATTELWRDKDANCCATGGRANLGFVIEGSSLKLDSLSVQAGGPDAEWKDH